MSLERGAGAVLVGDLLDREDAPVGGAHEEPRELTKSRVAERLRRPNGLAYDLDSRRLHLRHRLADVVDDEPHHEVRIVGDESLVSVLLGVHLDEVTAMRRQSLERNRLALACSL